MQEDEAEEHTERGEGEEEEEEEEKEEWTMREDGDMRRRDDDDDVVEERERGANRSHRFRLTIVEAEEDEART